jgi:hypothetical protein
MILSKDFSDGTRSQAFGKRASDLPLGRSGIQRKFFFCFFHFEECIQALREYGGKSGYKKSISRDPIIYDTKNLEFN